MDPIAPRILAIPGSLRTGSLNRKLLQVAIKELERLGAKVELFDLKASPLPVYDGDIEAQSGLPENAQKLKEMIERCDGLLIASPEYNYSVPGGLKNAIDWASRARPNPFKDKVAALMGATPGQFGTVRGQAVLRQSLMALALWVVPSSVTLGNATEAFDEAGNLKDPARMKDVAQVVGALVKEIQVRKGQGAAQANTH